MEHLNNKTMTTYAGEIRTCETQITFYIQCVKSQEILTRKLHKISSQNKNTIKLMKNTKSLLETEIKLDEQKKESLLIALDSMKARNIELRKEILLIKDRRQSIIEKRNINIKSYEDQWLMCQKRFENIPFIHRYLQINNNIDVLKENNTTLINEIKNKYSKIRIKEIELFNLDKKHVVHLADYMINKRLIILKNIKEKIAEIEVLEYQIEIKGSGRTNSLSSTISELLAPSTSKDVSMDIIQESSTVENNDTTVLPKLQLQYMDLDLLPVKFDQRVNFERVEAIKGSSDSAQNENFNISRKINVNKVNEEYVSPYFISPEEIKNPTQKFSGKKLIHILKDIKLDSSGSYKIVSKINTNELQNVNIIKGGVSQKDLRENDLLSSQEKVKEQVENEIFEEIDLTKTSQNILVPPSQFLDFTQSSQEKRVTFNSIITIQNSPNLVNNEKKSSDENKVNNVVINSELNVSTASDDSYKKIQDFVFKKHNLISSPEFTYGKNLVAPMLKEKGIPSNVLEEQNKDIDECGKQSLNFTPGTKNQLQLMEIVEDSKNLAHASNPLVSEQPTQTMQASDNPVEGKTCIQKNDGAVAGPSFRNYLQNIPSTFNISMNTTDCEDNDADFPLCVDSSLLLSPKADNEIPTSSNKTEVLSQDVPNFLSGLRKTGFSFFGSRGSDRNLESDIHSGNFNFTFGEEKKRGGLFNMFR